LEEPDGSVENLRFSPVSGLMTFDILKSVLADAMTDFIPGNPAALREIIAKTA
jgi:hypothetical protein